MQTLATELAALASHLGQRRDKILHAWRAAVRGDPQLTTGDSLPRAQLYDHIPGLLHAFEHKLDPAAAGAEGAAPQEQHESAAAHGLHRWQQGYDLREVTHELGLLNECVVDELEEYARQRPRLEHEVMAKARRIWAGLCSIGIAESTAQYFRLQQIEARGHMLDLEQALGKLRELEQTRAELWQQAAHDLRGNLGVVASATAGLAQHHTADAARERLLRLLGRNVVSLRHLLDDVTGLARLQAGQEQRRLATLDVAQLANELSEDLQSFAEQQGLALRCTGPAPFIVEGDAIKVRRIAQNLLINAIKYTRHGGVDLAWGDSADNDAKRWVLRVEDSGPGFHAGPGAPMAGAMEEATGVARQSEQPSATDVPATDAEPAAIDTRPVSQEQGEGIGLSIVKRLCELLDASVEMESVAGQGTRFRVLLPRHYG
jgi:signal transduction histidine kinase